MAFALDRVQHRFSTKRRQSVASSTSPSRDFRPAGVSPALVWATSAAESLPAWPGTAPAGPPPPPSGRPPAGHGARPSPRSDQFLPQRRQRPVTHRSGQHGLPQEVAQVVRQHEQLQPHLVVHKVVTGQSGPFDGVLAFLGREAPCGTGRQSPTRRERWKNLTTKKQSNEDQNRNFVSSLLCGSN